MRKIMLMLIACCGISLSSNRCQAQILDVIKAAIKAADVAVQKAQNRIIDLQNAQKAVENILSQTKLGEISDWTDKHRQQYAEYFNELHSVKEAISGFNNVREIMEKQVQLVNEYKQAYALYKKDNHFSPAEIQYMLDVYTGIVDESLKNLDQLFLVINPLQTDMTDGKRLQIINGVAGHIDGNLNDVREFNSQNALLSLQRAKDQNEVKRLKALYGLE